MPAGKSEHSTAQHGMACAGLWLVGVRCQAEPFAAASRQPAAVAAPRSQCTALLPPRVPEAALLHFSLVCYWLQHSPSLVPHLLMCLATLPFECSTAGNAAGAGGRGDCGDAVQPVPRGLCTADGGRGTTSWCEVGGVHVACGGGVAACRMACGWDQRAGQGDGWLGRVLFC